MPHAQQAHGQGQNGLDQNRAADQQQRSGKAETDLPPDRSAVFERCPHVLICDQVFDVVHILDQKRPVISQLGIELSYGFWRGLDAQHGGGRIAGGKQYNSIDHKDHRQEDGNRGQQTLQNIADHQAVHWTSKNCIRLLMRSSPTSRPSW